MHVDEKIITAFSISLLISIFFTKKIISFSTKYNFLDMPTEKRKLHSHGTSNLGGISIFIASMFSYFAFSDYTDTLRPDKLFSITILLFFIGLKDDIEPIKAWQRLFFEFLCAFFIIFITDIRIMRMYGIFTIDYLPYWGSFMLTSLFIVACINAYNMIDGIDGLLGILSLLGTSVYGYLFFVAGDWLWALLCTALAGSLIGFLIFNWQPAKIFMGNGGSMFLGTLIACLSLRFLQIEHIEGGFFEISMPHVIALGVISIPVFDLIAVFFSRIFSGMSPFQADNRHIHHRLTALDLQHQQAALIITACNILILIFAYYVQDTGALRSLIYTLLFCGLLNLVLGLIYWVVNYKKK